MKHGEVSKGAESIGPRADGCSKIARKEASATRHSSGSQHYARASRAKEAAKEIVRDSAEGLILGLMER